MYTSHFLGYCVIRIRALDQARRFIYSIALADPLRAFLLSLATCRQ